MFGRKYVSQLIDHSAETPADRRLFMKVAGATVRLSQGSTRGT